MCVRGDHRPSKTRGAFAAELLAAHPEPPSTDDARQVVDRLRHTLGFDVPAPLPARSGVYEVTCADGCARVA